MFIETLFTDAVKTGTHVAVSRLTDQTYVVHIINTMVFSALPPPHLPPKKKRKKEKKILPSANARMNLEDIIVSGTSQKDKDKYCTKYKPKLSQNQKLDLKKQRIEKWLLGAGG